MWDGGTCVQGTAATALAGLYGALKVQGLPLTALRHQKIVVVGAGSAGMGVVSMIAKGAPSFLLATWAA